MGKYELPKLTQEREIKVEQIEWHSRNFLKSQIYSPSLPKYLNVVSL